MWPAFLQMMLTSELLLGPLQIYDADAITVPFVEILSHLEAKVGATCLGSCCKEFKERLLHPL